MKYIVKKVKSQPSWSHIDGMTLTDNNGNPSKYLTTAKLCYNSDGMFFRYECQDNQANATMTGYNEPLYEEETVEFFFAPTKLERYLELEWNAVGGVFCANVNNDMQGSTGLEFVPENIIESDIETYMDRFVIEGFIPKELFEGKFEGVWRFNAYRIKRNKDNSMYLMAYSPTFIENFHKPLHFAELVFAKED